MFVDDVVTNFYTILVWYIHNSVQMRRLNPNEMLQIPVLKKFPIAFLYHQVIFQMILNLISISGSMSLKSGKDIRHFRWRKSVR